MKNNKFSTRDLVMVGIVAAMYYTITILTAQISYMGVQFRFAEGLLLLVFLEPKLIAGVLLGTFLANLFGPFALVDAVFGTLASLIAALLMYYASRKLKPSLLNMALTGVFPTIINAIYVPALLVMMDSSTGLADYFPIAISVAIGEFVVVSLVGSLVFKGLISNRAFMNYFSR